MIVVTVDRIYYQCTKAIIRSKLWDPETRIERRNFPSLGKILADQIGAADVAATERAIEEAYRDRLY